jgi:acyl carrier protein
MNTSDRIRTYIVEALLFDSGAQLAPTTSLLGSGVLDSTGVMDMIMFLEREFGIRVADEELIPDNLDSIERLARFVERKRSGSAGAASPGAGA